MTKSELMVKVSSAAGYEQDPEHLIKFAEEMWKLAFRELEPIEQVYLWNHIQPLVKEGEYEKIAGIFARIGRMGRSIGGAIKKTPGIISKGVGNPANAARVAPMNPTTLSPKGVEAWKASHRALKTKNPMAIS